MKSLRIKRVSRYLRTISLADFLRVSILRTLFYNYFSHHIRRKEGFLILQKKTRLVFEKNAIIVVEQGNCRLSGLIRLQRDSMLHLWGGVTIEYGADILLKPGAVFEIQKDSYINVRCLIRCNNKIRLGEGCVVSTDLRILDNDGHEINGIRKSNPVMIGNHVWIGMGVSILEGAVIEDGAVVGACSLVTNRVPGKTLVYGVPARVKKTSIEWAY